MKRERSPRFAGLLFAAVLLGVGCTSGLSYYPEDCADDLSCPGEACPGECVPLPPLGFDGPVLLWTGPAVEAPECPARAPRNVYEGNGDLQAAYTCPTCECTQPTCQLPAGVTAHNLAACQGSVSTPFNSPAEWSGACIPAAQIIPSVNLRSMTIEPVTVRPCEPVPPEVAEKPGPAGWGLFGRACSGEAIPNACENPGMTCLPTAEPPPPGFRQCVMSLLSGETECPDDFPERVDLFSTLDDTRSCTPCQCTETAPAQCEALLVTYEDQACQQVLGSGLVDTGPPACDPIMSATAELGSMSATWTTNQPGSCAASGGETIGQAVPIDPRIFCCQPPPGG